MVGKLEGTEKLSQGLFNAKNSVFSDASKKSDLTTISYINLNSIETLKLKDKSIDLLKCDIEGAELLFIENYKELLSRTKYAVFEFHPNYCDENQCLDLLKELGFDNQKMLSHNVCFFWK